MSVEMTPLPRGRHTLSRDEVVGSQRARLMRAMAEAMAENGYARTSVADILRRARVSRETFYELFDSKEGCFMASFEDIYAQIAAAMASGEGAGGPDAHPIDRFSAVLRDYLDALAADPISARVFLIEVYAAGPAAIERRLELQRSLVDGVTEVFGARTEEDRFSIEGMLAAVIAMVTARVALGDVKGLVELHGPLVKLARRIRIGEGPMPR